MKKLNDENTAFYEKKLNDIHQINMVYIKENIDSDPHSKNYYEFFRIQNI